MRIGTIGKRRKLLGVDIGSASVKVLELSGRNGSYCVESYALEALAPNVPVDGNSSEFGGVVEAINRARVRSGSRVSRAALAVGGPSVIARTVALDASLSDADMLARITADAERYIPYPLDEVAIDFEVRGLSEQQPEQAEVLLTACRRDDIDRLCRALRTARLEPAVVEPEAQAVERVFELLEPGFERQAGELVVAVADIGATTATLWVLVDGRVVFSRGQPLTERRPASAARERPPRRPAEAAGAGGHGGRQEESAGSPRWPCGEELARHLSRSLRLFFSSTHYTDVDRILLVGGAAAALGLPDALQNSLQAPAAVGDPFAGMALSAGVDAEELASDAPALALCCGLAMRGLR